MIALVKKADSLDAREAQEKPVARYLLLAHNIHARFTQQEEKERAALRAAEEKAKQKNAAIMQPVQEAVEFCQILIQTPGLREAFSANAKDIAARLLSNRYAYTVEDEPIAIRYEVPVFCVDMKAIDGTVLSGTKDAFLHIGLSPVKIAPAPEKPLDVPTMTTHTFYSKKYRIESDGRIMEDVKGERRKADPISDILTELRAHMGHDFFETVLLPHLEAQAKAMQA